MNALMTAKGLALSFGGIRAVDGVDFAVPQGAIFSIIGPNGAGKTSLFNIISRIYDPATGSLDYRGQDLLRVAPQHIARLGIARTFQNLELFENATVLDNLMLGRFVHRRTGVIENMLFTARVRAAEREDRRAVEEIIEFLDLEGYREATIHELPYGKRKIVELGRALATHPSLLLLDEPSSGLNPEETEDLSFWLEDIRADLKITILMIEHDMGLVGAVSDHVLVLDQGRVLTEGRPADVQNNPDVIRAYLGEVAA